MVLKVSGLEAYVLGLKLWGFGPYQLHEPQLCTHSGAVSCRSAHHDHSRGSLDAESGRITGTGRFTQTCEGPCPLPPWLPKYLTSLPMTSILCWTWGTHWRTMANSSGMVVCGSKRISWHAGSLGSKNVKARAVRGSKSPQAS